MLAIRKRTPDSQNDEELAIRLFTSIASVLLRLAIDAPKAERILREAFVRAAIENARASARRATQSRVASIAGISRLDVRKILSEEYAKGKRGVTNRSTRIERLLQGWRSDPHFLDRRGKPRALSFSGAKSDFTLLVRKYGRDVTARVLLEHLTRLRMVTERSGRVVLASAGRDAPIPSSAAQSDLRFLTTRLGEFNWREGRRSFSIAKVAISVGEKKTAQLVRRIALERIEAVLKSIGAIEGGTEMTNARGPRPGNRVLVTATIAADVEEPAQ